MAELKEVRLSLVDPNPFRDGSGGNPPATWESVAETYGFDEGKLAELTQSYQANGVWAGMHGRAVGSRYQLAFGHHRLEAARRCGVDRIPLILDDYSDDDMVKMMAAENSEEYGHDFALGVMNAVEAVVKAYGSGAIELEEPDYRGNKSSIRNAPSFIQGYDASKGRPYDGRSVGKYLGWLVIGPRHAAEGLQAAQRVLVALSALELIELGALKRTQLKGLGSTQARELISFTKRKVEAEREKLETQRVFLEKAKAAAAKQDDKRKVAQLTKKVEELAAESAKVVKTAGQAAASTVASYFKETGSMVEAARRAAEEHQLEKDAKPTVRVPKVVNLSSLDDFINKLDSTLLGDDARWAKILGLAEQLGEKKTFKTLEETLLQLAERAKLRARELKKAQEKKG